MKSESVALCLSLLLSVPVELFDFVQRGPSDSLESVSNVMPCYEVVPTQRNDVTEVRLSGSQRPIFEEKKNKKKNAHVFCCTLI